MVEKATKGRAKKVSVRLSETEYDMAQEIMTEYEIPSISVLFREFILEWYAFLLSEKQKQEGDPNDRKSL